MVILRTRNKITDFFMILAWASPFKANENYFISEPGSNLQKSDYLYIHVLVGVST